MTFEERQAIRLLVSEARRSRGYMCDRCGEPFTPNYRQTGTQLYCSARCRRDAERIKL